MSLQWADFHCNSGTIIKCGSILNKLLDPNSLLIDNQQSPPLFCHSSTYAKIPKLCFSVPCKHIRSFYKNTVKKVVVF